MSLFHHWKYSNDGDIIHIRCNEYELKVSSYQCIDELWEAYNVIPFPFSEDDYYELSFSTQKAFDAIRKFMFLKEDIDKLLHTENLQDNQNQPFGLSYIIADMLKNGKTKSEVARTLREKGLSLSIIGALLYEGGLNKEGHFTTQKQCSDFYQKKEQALLKGDSEEKA